MIITLNSNLKGSFFEKMEQRERIMQNYIESGELYKLAHKLFITQDYSDFKNILEKLFCEDLTFKDKRVSKLFNSNVKEEKFIAEYSPHVNFTNILVWLL